MAQRAARGEANDTGRRTSRPVSDIVRANVLTRFNAIVGSLCAVVLVTGHPQDALFGLVVVANTGIGVVQELRAKRTLDRLAVLGEEPARVVRDGAQTQVRPGEIVRGDRILIGSGDRVLVDGEVTDSSGLELDESLLTGETDPVAKNPGDQVLSGSFVVTGSGGFTATRVGRQSYAARLEAEASVFGLARSELMAGINRFLRLITWVIIPVAALLTASQLAYASGAFPDAVAGAVAGIITMIPEGLVLLTSVAFAVGVIRLGRRQCLVQELPAIEVLARVDVLCLDKTGTLTEPGMELDQLVELVPGTPARRVLASLAGADDRPNATLLAITSGLGGEAGWLPARLVPFSSGRKWSGAVFADAGPATGGWVLGAPDVLLAADDPARAQAQARAAQGLRVLVLGRADPDSLADPGGPALDGRPVAAEALLVLRQRLRADAPRTLAYFAEQNVAVKVISGDNPASVGAIARQLGIDGAGHPVDARTLPAGEEVTGAGENGHGLTVLADALEGNSVFGRVTPRQKQDFVTALQSRGHTVAMTGDGINDVLALTRADLGVAMGSGSGATRAVAKIVLLDDSFATLPHVVAEGRRVLGNIERVASLFLTKTAYAVLLSTATAAVGLAAAAGLQGLRFPFLPRHLTLISTLTIGVPAFVLALAPSQQRVQPGFVSRVLRFAVPSGIACAAATFAAYLLARLSPGTDLAADRTTAVVALSATALWVLALVARPYTWWRIALVAAMAAGMLLALAIPASRTFFALGHFNPAIDAIALAIAGCAGVALTVFLMASGRLPGGKAPRADH
ncbi:MAG TPA: HAD-IC family P-type ATPase [Streptosporangiaceae bacterium]|nr:HAD-IC family P-type ATPase [Streptosporangiaceae bacterium]